MKSRCLRACVIAVVAISAAIMPARMEARQARQVKTLPELLTAVSAYLQVFIERFANVVATEQYQQERVRGIRGGKHVLTSDFFLINLPGSGEWIECRDIYEADGKAVGDREKRLLKLLKDGSTKDWASRAATVARESTRYNLNDEIGTINRPLVALALVQPAFRSQFEFTIDRDDAKADAGTRVVAFREVGTLPLAKQSPLWGRVWVDDSGVILRTELSFGKKSSPHQILTTFKTDPSLGVAVPVEMVERYYFGGVLGEVHGRAMYGQFRRFGVTSTETYGK